MKENRNKHRCKKCKIYFMSSSDTQIYCNACLTDAYYQDLFEKNNFVKECQFCGRAFETTLKDKEVCSPVCKVELSKIKTPNNPILSSNCYLKIDRDLEKKIKKKKVIFQHKQFANYLKATTWEM